MTGTWTDSAIDPYGGLVMHPTCTTCAIVSAENVVSFELGWLRCFGSSAACVIIPCGICRDS